MKRAPLLTALAAAGACLAWMALTVHFNYGGNWTALFCTGAMLRRPPLLASENLYVFADSAGYDGQFYHYQAHDPFFRRGLSSYIDSPLLRYRRMLVPTAAWLLAMGQDRWVDPAFMAIIVGSVFLGVVWSSRFAGQLGRSPAWGLLFLLVPATPIALDRMIIDVTLAALAAGLALHGRERLSWKTLLILTLAALTRETGCLLAVAYALYWLLRRQWRPAALCCASLLPALLWYAFVARNAPPELMLGAAQSAQLRSPLVWLKPTDYDLPSAVRLASQVLDYVLLAGVLFAIALAVLVSLRKNPAPLDCARLAYAALLVLFLSMFGPGDAFALPRIASPLLLLLAMQGSRIALVPLLLAAPRLFVQFVPQLAGILRGLI